MSSRPVVLVTGAAVLVLSGVVLDGAIAVADRSFSVLDTTTNEAVDGPLSPMRCRGRSYPPRSAR